VASGCAVTTHRVSEKERRGGVANDEKRGEEEKGEMLVVCRTNVRKKKK